MPDPKPPIPMDAEQKGQWESRIREARQYREEFEELWKTNLARTYPDPQEMQQRKEKGRYSVNTGVDFRQTERKKHLLWYQLPKVALTAEDPIGTPIQDAILIHQAILNKKIGAKHDGGDCDLKRCMQRTVLDALCPSGWGAAEIGYSQFSINVDQEVPIMDPVSGPIMNPATGGPFTETQSIPVPIHVEYFCTRFSYKRLLVPKDWDSIDFDEAPWIGREFSMPLEQARREKIVPPDFEGKTNDKYQGKDGEPVKTSYKIVTGQKIWLRAHYFESGPVHPLLIRELILIDGLETPGRYRDCEYQTFTPQGQLTDDSLTGFPIDVLTLREVPDSAYVPSDSTATRGLTDELNIFRGQLIRQRDASTGYMMFREDALSDEDVTQIKEGNFNKVWIPVENLEAANPPIQRGETPTIPRENYTAQDYIERDLERQLGFGANQTGVAQKGRRTATESQNIQQNTEALLAGEQDRVVDCFLRRVRKIDTLVQRYTSPNKQEVIKYVGPNGEQRYAPWVPAVVPGKYAYTIKPDSQLRLDAAADRAQHLDFYVRTANDPYINRMESARDLVTKFGKDPAKYVIQPPPPGPPPPNVAVRVDVQYLHPMMPQFPFVLELLEQAGYKFSPDALSNSMALAAHEQTMGMLMGAAAGGVPQSGKKAGNGKPQGQLPHGQSLTPLAPISKHAADRTGELPGPGPSTSSTPSAGGSPGHA